MEGTSSSCKLPSEQTSASVTSLSKPAQSTASRPCCITRKTKTNINQKQKLYFWKQNPTESESEREKEYILESLLGAPPVTLATRRRASSALRSLSWFNSSAFVFWRNSWTLILAVSFSQTHGNQKSKTCFLNQKSICFWKHRTAQKRVIRVLAVPIAARLWASLRRMKLFLYERKETLGKWEGSRACLYIYMY